LNENIIYRHLSKKKINEFSLYPFNKNLSIYNDKYLITGKNILNILSISLDHRNINDIIRDLEKFTNDFLNTLAKKNDGIVCVAHHADDVLESICINIIRGTGWRGLAPMSASNIERPLLDWRKKDIYRYACEHNLSFRQDQTNTEGDYLRNRVREKLCGLSEEDKTKLLELYVSQKKIRGEYEEIMAVIIKGEEAGYCQKRLILESPHECALEIMREWLLTNGVSLTRPQLEKCINAVREYAPNKKLSLDREHFLEVGKYSFRVV
jgi:tRNA(Ile)-lysidine synthase TilS/MesJ